MPPGNGGLFKDGGTSEHVPENGSLAPSVPMAAVTRR